MDIDQRSLSLQGSKVKFCGPTSVSTMIKLRVGEWGGIKPKLGWATISNCCVFLWRAHFSDWFKLVIDSSLQLHPLSGSCNLTKLFHLSFQILGGWLTDPCKAKWHYHHNDSLTSCYAGIHLTPRMQILFTSCPMDKHSCWRKALPSGWFRMDLKSCQSTTHQADVEELFFQDYPQCLSSFVRLLSQEKLLTNKSGLLIWSVYVKEIQLACVLLGFFSPVNIPRVENHSGSLLCLSWVCI